MDILWKTLMTLGVIAIITMSVVMGARIVNDIQEEKHACDRLGWTWHPIALNCSEPWRD